MTRNLVIVILVFVAISTVSSKPNGAPKAACQSVSPVGHKSFAPNIHTGENHYTIASLCYVFRPGESMLMKVWDPTDTPFLGLILQVRRYNPSAPAATYKRRIAGSFGVFSGRFKTMDCKGVNTMDTVTHADKKPKLPSEHLFNWTSPSTCEDSEEFEIMATVLEKVNQWETIRVRLACKPDYSDRALMERVRPPQSNQYCSQTSWAYLPASVATSFEGGFDGWMHLNKDSEYQWKRTNMPTPTAGTGPAAAYDGDWYLHYEATGPIEHDAASIYSIYGTTGCFCFSFWCHMRTDGEVMFTVTAVGSHSKTFVRTKLVTPFWRQVKATLLSEVPVTIVIQVFRGSTEKADIGLDKIDVKAGPCTISNNPMPGEPTDNNQIIVSDLTRP